MIAVIEQLALPKRRSLEGQRAFEIGKFGTNEISADSDAGNNIAIPCQQLRAAGKGTWQNAE